MDILLEFVSDEEHSVLISSHILSDLEKVCDYITFIAAGQVVLSDEKAVLEEKYAVAHYAKEEFSSMDKSAVVRYRTGAYSVDRLMLKDSLPAGTAADKASLEDIMIYFVKGEKI